MLSYQVTSSNSSANVRTTTRIKNHFDTLNQEGLINNDNNTLCGISYHTVPTDFRSKNGRILRKKCKSIEQTRDLKRLILWLRQSTPVRSKNLQTASINSLNRLHMLILSFWRRRQIKHQGLGIHMQSL